MMHKPAVTDILKSNESYYSLVMAVAKRARDIASEAELNERRNYRGKTGTDCSGAVCQRRV